MAESGGTSGNGNDGKGGNSNTGNGNDGKGGNSNSTGTGNGAVGGGTPSGGLGGGGDNSNNNSNDSDNAPAAPAADTTTNTTDTDPAKATDTGYNFAGIIGTDLSNTKASLSLSDDAAKAAALSASFGAMPASLSSLAADTAVSHIGKAGFQGAMAGFATESGKVGLSVGIDAATNPASITSALSSFTSKSLGLNTTAHNIGHTIGSYAGSPMGPVGAAVGGLLGAVAAELGLDALQARDNETVKDALEEGLGPIDGRLTARSMSDLSIEGFNKGLNDPSLSGLDAYSAGVIGQAEAVAAAAENLADPTEGIGVSLGAISGINDTPDSLHSMDMSHEIADTLSNVEAALSEVAKAPDRSGELGSIGITAASVDAQEASMNALGNNSSFTPTRSYGWLRAGLPVSVPSSPYRNSYWDGTRFVNMNDYRGFM